MLVAEVVTDARDHGAFIPSSLDDYPLTPIEFRLYCRITRRAGGGGSFWESDRSLAATWGVSDRTIRDAKSVLVAAGLVRCKKRPGQANVYTLTPESEWASSGDVVGLREGTKTDRRTRAERGLPPRAEGCGPEDRGGSEGGAVLGTEGCGPGDRGGAVLGTDKGTPMKVLQEGTPGSDPPSLLKLVQDDDSPAVASGPDFEEEFWLRYPKRNGVRQGKKKTALEWAKLSTEEQRAACSVLSVYAACADGYPRDPERYLRDRLWEDFAADDRHASERAPWSGLSFEAPRVVFQ